MSAPFDAHSYETTRAQQDTLDRLATAHTSVAVDQGNHGVLKATLWDEGKRGRLITAVVTIHRDGGCSR